MTIPYFAIGAKNPSSIITSMALRRKQTNHEVQKLRNEAGPAQILLTLFRYAGLFGSDEGNNYTGLKTN